jgi:hypothetical protein
MSSNTDPENEKGENEKGTFYFSVKAELPLFNLHQSVALDASVLERKRERKRGHSTFPILQNVPFFNPPFFNPPFFNPPFFNPFSISTRRDW